MSSRPQFFDAKTDPRPDPFKYKHQTSEELVYNYMKYSLHNPYADLHPILGNNYVKGIDNNSLLTKEQKEGAKDYLHLLRVQAQESRKRYNKRREEINDESRQIERSKKESGESAGEVG